MEQVEKVLDLKAVEAQMMSTHSALESFIKKAEGEQAVARTSSAETKAAIDKLSEKAIQLGDKIADLEQKSVQHFEAAEEVKSAGQLLTETDDFKAFVQRGRGSAQIEIKTAIVNATPSMSAPLVVGHRLNTVVKEPDRALRVRDVLPVGQTDSNIVFYPKENTFTNNAAVVVGGSPTVSAENVTKPESALTFTSGSAEVKTIAHFIPVSKQALSDSAFLRSYIDTRLFYGLKLKEDTELLTGAGTLGTITGLYTARTAYTSSSPITYSTKLDVLRNAKAQAHVANYEPDVVFLNPADWAAIELAKETGGLYIFSHPQGVIDQRIWGMRVVVTNSMTAGTFLVAASASAQIWDRESATVAISYEDSTNFQKNMATILCEERLAFTIYNAGGLIGGSFTVS
jgi:HK97 family phage major capsid protein